MNKSNYDHHALHLFDQLEASTYLAYQSAQTPYLEDHLGIRRSHVSKRDSTPPGEIAQYAELNAMEIVQLSAFHQLLAGSRP
jgi:hypothetical protein